MTAPAISFVVPGNAVPKARPRSVRLPNGKIRTYTPARTQHYEQKVAIYALQILKGANWPIADAKSRFHMRVLLVFADLRRRDGDNCVKVIQDALNGIAYADDYQVVSHAVSRSLDRANPRTEVVITRLEASR
ncbi:MAG TPA: RusA family crossover junction endodeoxyribonuclease [bacterium]|nr:RusA family crossover junction endodeoxyribonuclease [bacterium]